MWKFISNKRAERMQLTYCVLVILFVFQKLFSLNKL